MNDVRGDSLISSVEAIKSKADFAAFVRLLAQNYREHPGEWDNASLSQFLESLAAFSDDIEGYYANIGVALDMGQPNWRVFADILLGARVYD
jgi:hypothetical protein